MDNKTGGREVNDLISRHDVEKAIKEFFKNQVDELPKNTGLEIVTDLCELYLSFNVDLLKSISKIPATHDADKVVERLNELQQYYIYSITDLVKLSDVIKIVKAEGEALHEDAT